MKDNFRIPLDEYDLISKYLLFITTINTSIDIYRSISREEIREVAQKYLSKNQRVEIEYLPGEE